MGCFRTDLTFRRITPEESRIYQDGTIVGEVYRQEDILNRGRHYYVIHLSEDHRGPVQGARSRVHSLRSAAPGGHASAVVVTLAGANVFPRLRRGTSFKGRVGATPSGRAIRCNPRSLALPGIYAPIPVAFARWRSLRAPLATEKEADIHGCHPVVMSHCATRARSSNPAGPSLRSGLLQGDGHLRLKIHCANGLSRAGRESRRP